MSPGSTHVITGGTGLVGSSLILELAARTDDRFVCLVRPGRMAPDVRLRAALHRAADCYALPATDADDAMGRVLVVPADITLGPDSMRIPQVPGPVEVWHCASRPNLTPTDRMRVFAVNVTGTRAVLHLAKQLGAQRFNHFSTAFVAPSAKQGLVLEEPVVTRAFRNAFEESKTEAERVVRSQRDIPARILRPGAVVAHSRTFRYPSKPNGVYLLQRAFADFRRKCGPNRAVLKRRVMALPEESCSLVPVDHVVQDAVEISLNGPADGIFHLTNPHPPTNGQVIRAVAANCGMAVPEFTRDPGHMDRHDMLLHRLIGTYAPYLNVRQRFDRSRTDSATRRLPPVRCDLSGYTLQAILRAGGG